MESHLTPLVSVDLQAFSDRAAEWTEAHQQHRGDARTRALSLAAQARAEQESQAAAVTATVQTPATTAPPPTAASTAAPTTTGVPETTAPATTASATTAPATTASATTAPTTGGGTATGTETTATDAPDSTVAATVPTEEQWEGLRQCESSGNYRAISISPAGRYRGAYQFSRSTWDWVAPQIGADHLVGVDPATASPADQDRMAQALWDINGWAPWPACSRRLGYL